MRKLNVEDSFAFSEILDKMGIQDDINELMDKARSKGKDGQAWLGGQLILLMIKKIHKAKEEVIEFLSSLFYIEANELKKKPVKELVSMITELFSSEDFKDFFQ